MALIVQPGLCLLSSDLDSAFPIAFFGPVKRLISHGWAVGFTSGYMRDGKGPRGHRVQPIRCWRRQVSRFRSHVIQGYSESFSVPVPLPLER